MKVTILSSLTILFLVLGTIFFQESNSNVKSKTSFSPETHADWPEFKFDDLMGLVDVVALASIEDIKEKITNEDEPKAKLVTAKVKKNFYGNANETIIIDQAAEFMEKGKTYILFLEKNGDFYYEIDANSKIVSEGDNFNVKIPGLVGRFTAEQFSKYFNSKIRTLE